MLKLLAKSLEDARVIEAVIKLNPVSPIIAAITAADASADIQIEGTKVLTRLAKVESVRDTIRTCGMLPYIRNKSQLFQVESSL